MKNILTTAGLAAVAVAGFQSTCAAQAVTVDDSKWWQVSAALRGFYDDNYLTAPEELAQESLGFEVRPGVTVGHKGEQHLIKLSTTYSARWFEDREDEEWDHSLLVDLAGEYQVTENHVLRLNDTFTYASEGALLDQNGVITTPIRSDNSNLRNLADLKYVGQLTRLIGLELGYQNTIYDYDQEGVGSYSAILDRTEHLLRGETRWTITPTLAGILGYWYEMVNFSGDEFIGAFNPSKSDIRDSSSHFFVAGADYTVSPHCFVSIRGGAQNVTYDNLAGEPDEWNGFGDVNATFEYAEDSYFRLGGKYGRNRTDLVGYINSGNLTLDQETVTIYGMVNHKLTEALTARASGQVQFGTFNGGGYDDQAEGLYVLGLTLSYELNQYLALEGGYNYDRLDSDDAQRTYSRNRVFLGVRGQF
ncbi:MAG: outer membrane beta-barrel protein [Verrucomicrobiales bacterium]|nr:outer membrane beta-barrel protein [Verrucomicrobiales bacterium]